MAEASPHPSPLAADRSVRWGRRKGRGGSSGCADGDTNVTSPARPVACSSCRRLDLSPARPVAGSTCRRLVLSSAR